MSSRKWAVVALLSLGMIIGYIDRANLSVVLVAPEVRSAFHLTDFLRGLLNSTFFWSYALLQIPAGWIIDRFGVRKPYAIGFLFWTLVSAATGLVTNVSQLVTFRLLLGAGEAVSGPASLRWIRWNCPEERRGLATGIYFAGTKIGSAIGVPVAAFLMTAFSWRVMFLVCGLAGLVWLAGWLVLVRESEQTPPSDGQQGREASINFSKLMSNPVIWGILIGTFSYGYFLFFCLTWLPAYLVESRGLNLNSMGLYALFSFGGMAIIAILAGWLADELIRRGHDPIQTRKGFTIAGFLLASTEVFGALSHSETVALFFAVFSLSGLGLATANYWALTQTIVPAGAMGRIGGIQNCASNLGGVIAPILTGWLKEVSGGYRVPMQAIWFVLLTGVASYLILVRRIEPHRWLAAEAAD